MQFTLIDRITRIDPGERITALKSLSLAEDYLQDHFPRFPVMPGVLMLESLFQASSFLVYYSEQFKHAVVLLKEARNIKYADFVAPGQQLVVEAQIVKQDEETTTLKAEATVDGRRAVSGRLILEKFNLADRHACHAGTDDVVRQKMRAKLDLLYQPA